MYIKTRAEYLGTNLAKYIHRLKYYHIRVVEMDAINGVILLIKSSQVEGNYQLGYHYQSDKIYCGHHSAWVSEVCSQ